MLKRDYSWPPETVQDRVLSYLVSTRQTRAEAAAALGVTVAAIGHWANGRRMPSLRVRYLIDKAAPAPEPEKPKKPAVKMMGIPYSLDDWDRDNAPVRITNFFDCSKQSKQAFAKLARVTPALVSAWLVGRSVPNEFARRAIQQYVEAHADPAPALAPNAPEAEILAFLKP